MSRRLLPNRVFRLNEIRLLLEISIATPQPAAGLVVPVSFLFSLEVGVVQPGGFWLGVAETYFNIYGVALYHSSKDSVRIL